MNPRLKKAFVASIAGSALLTSVAMATPVGSATISETGNGPVFTYSLTLNNNSSLPATSTNTIGTFWFAWIPGQDYLKTSPLTVSVPSGWTYSITGGSANDGYAIRWVASNSASYVSAGNSLTGFGFTSNDAPASVFGNSFYFPSTPVLTSFVYEGAPFSDGGNQFVASAVPEPASAGCSLLLLGLLVRRRFTAGNTV